MAAIPPQETDAAPRPESPFKGLDLQVGTVAAPVRDRVCNQLREAIVHLHLRPGQRLVERELTEATGASRATIREALQQLSAEGLLSTARGKGWVVAMPTREEAEELYEVRALLEGMAGRRFAERATDDELKALEDAVAALERLLRQGWDNSVSIKLKSRFYDVLFTGAGSTAVREIVVGLQARVTALRATSLSQPGRPAHMVKEMKAIVSAALSRDPSATEEACVYHVRQAAEVALRAIEDI